MSTRHALWGVALAFGFLGAPSPVTAHPHVWATVRSEILLDANHQITGIRHAWTFDEFYTAMAVEGLDTNKDGVYSKEELQPLAKVNVESLKDFDYFTFVHFEGEDDKMLPLKPPIDYWIDYDKNVLTLHFTLPLEKPVDTHGKPVQGSASGRAPVRSWFSSLRWRKDCFGQVSPPPSPWRSVPPSPSRCSRRLRSARASSRSSLAARRHLG